MVTKVVPEHVGVHPGDPHAPGVGQVSETKSGGMAVLPHPSLVAQQWSFGAPGHGPVQSAPDRRRQRHQHDPVALAVHLQDAVSVFLTEVADVGAGSFEDPQAEQPEHGDQREVVRVA